jgi:hypothetical protein
MKKIYTLVGASIFFGSVIAQQSTNVETYDFNPSNKYPAHGISTVQNRTTEGQDRATFYSTDFDTDMEGWAADVQAGNAGFELTTAGHVNNSSNTFQIPVLASSTPTQWIVIDSDGTPDASYSNPEEATFNSPKIDLDQAGVTGASFFALQFEQFFAEWEPTTGNDAGATADHCYIAVSNDSTNWTEIEINQGVGRDARPNPENISWNITDLVSGDLTSVFLRFRWEGAYNYGWQIDNIKIEDIPEKDISITQTWRNDYQGITYSKVPLEQVRPITIGAVIQNNGYLDQTGVTFDYVIKDGSGTSLSNGTATGAELSLTSGQYDTIFYETGYTPTSLGTYTIEWTAVSTEGDDDNTNDVVTDTHMEVTNYILAQHYEEGDVVEFSTFPGQTSGYLSYGILGNFIEPTTISGVNFELTSYTENIGEDIEAVVMAVFGQNWEEVQSDEHTITSDDISNKISIAFDGGIEIDTSLLYFVGVRQLVTPEKPLFMRQGDIKWGNIQGFNQDNGGLGFFDRLSPIVEIRTNAGEVSIEESSSQNEGTTVYPNPANANINVELTYSSSTNTLVNVTDITGKVCKTIALGTVNGTETLSISIEDLKSGVYFVEVITTNSKEVKKFVKK